MKETKTPSLRKRKQKRLGKAKQCVCLRLGKTTKPEHATKQRRLLFSSTSTQKHPAFQEKRRERFRLYPPTRRARDPASPPDPRSGQAFPRQPAKRAAELAPSLSSLGLSSRGGLLRPVPLRSTAAEGEARGS